MFDMSGTQSVQPVQIAERQDYEREVSKDPRMPGPWLELIAHVRRGGSTDDIRDVYDRFFEFFPQAAVQWIEYVNWELSQSNFSEVDAIFVRCLRTTLSVDLWKVYLAYTRRVNPLPPFTAEENSPRDQTRQVLEDAYEFALKYIGWDRESGPIWQEYIQLIREREVRGAWQEGQRMDQLRRVYQRAVSIPLDHVEVIWKDYDAFENSLNKLTAKKFLGEHSPAYMQARTVLREMRRLTESLSRPAVPSPPVWIAPQTKRNTSAGQEQESYAAWRAYLSWEQANPLAYDDPLTLQSRVLAAYKKATMCVRFDAVIWYMAASFCRMSQRENEMLVWLRDGIEACPWSLLLRFSYADASTSLGRLADATAALDDLVLYTQHQVDMRLNALAELKARVDAEISRQRKQRLEQHAQVDSAPDEDDGDKVELADIERRLQEERMSQHQQLERDAQGELEVWRAAVSQVWIKYMQFVRRTEGIRPTRQVFSRARKSAHCSWQVYEANAMLEYHCSKEPLVATKVFELALKTYGANEELVVRYLDFLLSINDDANARAVLERTVSSMPPERARIIWDRWSDYEYSYGDANGIARLEARMADMYPDRSAADCAADRLRYGSLDWVRLRDIGLAASVPYVGATSIARMPGRDINALESIKAAVSGANTAAAPSTVANAVADAAGLVALPGAVTTAPDLLSTEACTSSNPASATKTDVPNNSSGSGRQTMEDIRRSLTSTASDPVKRTRGKNETDKLAKKARGGPDAQSHTRKGGSRDTPPPPPMIPDAILYFMSLLPNAYTYDGPPIPPEAITECLLRSSLPVMPLCADVRKVGKRRT